MPSKKRNEISERFLRAYRLLYADRKVEQKKDFCSAVCLPQQNFSSMEKGICSCTVDHIYNLSTKYGVSLDWIFFGTGDFYANR
jgi:hypothetical protein